MLVIFQVKRLTQTLSATTAQEGAVHPKEQEWEDKNLSQVQHQCLDCTVFSYAGVALVSEMSVLAPLYYCYGPRDRTDTEGWG